MANANGRSTTLEWSTARCVRPWAGPSSSDRDAARRSAVVVAYGRRSGGEPLRLVLYFRGDLLEFWLELATVVGAEQELATSGQYDAQVSLGAATVTAVSCGQRARGCQNSSHVASSLARRAVVPGSTSNQSKMFRPRGASFGFAFRDGWMLPVGGERAVLLGVRSLSFLRGLSSCRL